MGGFTPIAISPGSYNADVVVENTAPATLSSAASATMDRGTNNTGSTWYEVGYSSAYPSSGLPAHNSLVSSSIGGVNYTFRMAPDYAANNVIFVGHGMNAGSPIVEKGTLTLSTPAAYTALSFLSASQVGTGGQVPIRYVIHYADSSTEEGQFYSQDWQSNADPIYTCAGALSLSSGNYNNQNTTNKRIYRNDVTLSYPSLNVTSVDFYYDGLAYANDRAMVFALSGSTDSINFNPVTVTGYNYDGVFEAGGPLNVEFPANILTATMDNGTSKGNNYTWYERGYFARFPSSGLPMAGTMLTSTWLNATYQMPASYTANNAVMLDTTFAVANIPLSTPAAYEALSFLVSGANGSTTVQVVLQFQDGSTETNAISTPDWFNTGIPCAYVAYGRVSNGRRHIANSPEVDVFPPLDSRTAVNPCPRLYDAIVPVANTSGVITNILLVRTGGARGVVFAVSGAAAGSVPPLIATQPASAKGLAGSTVALSAVVSGTPPLSYQWRRAPKGGGLYGSFDFSTFANLSDGGNITGANSNTLTISPGTVVNSGDYVLVVTNAYGAVTSFVATLTVFTTNSSVLIGASYGDVVAKDFNGDWPNSGESVEKLIDRVIQKGLARGLNFNNLPFAGPVGFNVTPVQGASVVTALRFYPANDATGRDPADYGLEGSNDGGSTWTPITGGVLKGTLALPTGRNGSGGTAVDPLTQYVQEVDFANTNSYKAYRVALTNNYSPYTDTLLQIGEVELLGTLVPNPPVFTQVPEPAVIVFAGASASFSVAASGYPAPTYEWFMNMTTPIPGATNATYTFANAQPANSGTTFFCRARNTFGTTNSPTATLTVIAAPTGQYPVAVLADQPFGYWRLNETPDNGMGNNGTIAHDYRGGHNGSYNNCAIAVSGFNPTADTDTAAEFGGSATDSYVGNIQGVDFAAPAGAPVNFSIEAWVNGPMQTQDAGIVAKGAGGGGEQFDLDTGGGNHGFRFFYRDASGNTHGASSSVALDGAWHHVVGVCDQTSGQTRLYIDGLLVATGDAPALGVLASGVPMSIGSRKTSDVSAYDVQFVGKIDDVAAYGYALTSAQVLAHYYAAAPAPIITRSPADLTVPENTTATFFSSAYGPGTLSYQWYYDALGGDPATPLAGQTSSNLVLTSVTAAMNGYSYRVIVTNAYGSATSAVAMLTVASGPAYFTSDLPAERFAYAGKTVMSVSVLGSAPFAYQWKSNGVPMVNGGRISGADTDTLTIANSFRTDSATYSVAVQGAQGGQLASTAMALTLQTLPNFNTNGLGWATNGSLKDGSIAAPATISNGVLALTVSAGGTRRSAWYTSPLYIGAFKASFVYQDVGGGGADGITFTLQNDSRGTTALGGSGGGLGYEGITPSASLQFNIYGTAGIAFNTGGVKGNYMPSTPVNVAGGDPIQTDLIYLGGVLRVVLSNTVSAATFTTNISVNLPSVVGAGTAYVGFTGADGGAVATQLITGFTFVPLTLLAEQSAAGTIVLSWPDPIGGYQPQATDSLTSPNWTDVMLPVSAVGGQFRVTPPTTGEQRYYRLVLKP